VFAVFSYTAAWYCQTTGKYVCPYYVAIWHLPRAAPGPFEMEIGTLVTPALGNVHINFGFSVPS